MDDLCSTGAARFEKDDIPHLQQALHIPVVILTTENRLRVLGIEVLCVTLRLPFLPHVP